MYREKIIAEAVTWLRTPFHHEARVKGHGVDCLQFIIACYVKAGLLPKNIDKHIYRYACDEHLHNPDEQFIEALQDHGWYETDTLKPGDVILYKVGKRFSHGVIYLGDQQGIHSYIGIGVCYADVVEDAVLANREFKYFTMGKD